MKTIVWVFLAITQIALAQNKVSADAKLVSRVCDCAFKNQISKNNKDFVLGLCILETITYYKENSKNFLLAVQISEDVDLVALGSSIILQIINQNPTLNGIISNQKTADTSTKTITGVYNDCRVGNYLTVFMRDEQGNPQQFIILNPFINSDQFIRNVLPSNSKLEIKYYTTNLYNSEQKKFSSYNVITEFSQK